MSLPVQVQRQIDRANELIGQVDPATGQPIVEPVAVPPEANPPVEPVAPVAPVAPAEPPAQAAPAAPPVVVQDWEQKYRTLQGVFAAESGRLNGEKKVLEARIVALEQAALAPAPAPQAPVRVANDKDLETYGPEMLEVISRHATEIAKRIVDEQMAATKPALDTIVADVKNVQASVQLTREDKFYNTLAETVPDWNAINSDPKFLAWCGEIDPMSGRPRQFFLDDAAAHMDAPRAAAMFTAYKNAAGITAPAPAPVVPAPAQPSPSPRPVGTASAPRMTAPKEGVTRTEIGAHYARAARDQTYRGSTAHQAFETRMAAALASNQVLEE